MSQADDDSSLSEAEAAELRSVLEAALRPGELDPATNERMIELSLQAPLAPASAEELAEAERLREALEARAPHRDSALLDALKHAAQPQADADAVERALRRALAEPEPRAGGSGRRGNVVYAAFGAAGALLAAAAVALLFVRAAGEAAAPRPLEYHQARSTSALFSERFDTEDTTARMDRIALERGRELRDNRYAAWGVR